MVPSNSGGKRPPSTAIVPARSGGLSSISTHTTLDYEKGGYRSYTPRVLSKLGRRTGKGNRWTQARVATVRRKHGIVGPVASDRDLDIFNLAQAKKITGVSDPTLMRLIKAKLLPAAQVEPYAPIEIKGRDLDREPVASILEHLRMTGRLVLTGDLSAAQTSLL